MRKAADISGNGERRRLGLGRGATFVAAYLFRPRPEKFDAMATGALELVYHNPHTRIYRVVEGQPPPLVAAPSP